MKKLLITGCARSGTGYIAKLLSFIGLEVGHERLKENGIVSWYNAEQPDYIYKNKETLMFSSGFKNYDLTIHQVRHPLKVISSMHVTNKTKWDYIMSVVPEIHPNDHVTIKCAKYWYYWNKKAEKLGGYLMRIEDIEKKFNTLNKELDNRKKSS